MGMTVYDALVIQEVAKRLPQKRNVLTLGVPTLNFQSQEVLATMPEAGRYAFHTAADFFKLLGFAEVDALDISNYEGANVMGDLSDPLLAQKIGKKYDLIYDSGTVEHVFDIVQAFRTVHALVSVDGAVIHATPANGFVDHGFWQVSPDLLRTLYGSSGYSLLTSAFFVFGPRPYSLPAHENVYRKRGREFVMRNLPETIAVFSAQKRQDVPMGSMKLQQYYSELHGRESATCSLAFYQPFGSPALGRLSRNRLLNWFISVAGKLRRTFIR